MTNTKLDNLRRLNQLRSAHDQGVEITKEEFDILAEAAAKNGKLKVRNGTHGKEFAVFCGATLAATAAPDEDGDYHYMYHLYHG